MSIEDDILIERFLRGELDSEELKTFKARLNKDSEFKSDFELEAQLFNGLNEDQWSFMQDTNNDEVLEYRQLIDSEEVQRLSHKLVLINKDYNTDKKPASIRWIVYLAAASIVLFFAINFLMPSRSSFNLYNEYINIEELPSLVTRGDVSDDIVNAENLFRNKAYNDALPIFRIGLSENPNNANLYIYKGITEVELNKFAEAEKTFNSLIKSKLIDAQKGYWYRGLLYLKMDDEVKAKATFMEIVDKKLFNYQRAQKILDEI